MAIILGHNDILLGIFILDGTNRSYISQVVGTDDDTTGMDADLAVGVFQFLGIGQHRRDVLVVTFNQLFQLWHIFITVFQVDLRHLLGQLAFHGFYRCLVEIAVRDKALDFVDLGQWHLLHTSHIGNG